MSNQIWEQAISKKGLEAGWHLTRAELQSGFYFDQYNQQAVAQNLKAQIAEIRRQLVTDTYRFRPLRQVPIPKGSLSTRPGAYMPLRDRIVLWSIVRKLAPHFDKILSKNVYSYRLKQNPKKGELFRESDVLDIPFLKKKEISKELDPFEPWYEAWPDFEERTKDEIGGGYNFLAVTDIAGYFENINIDILKDQIISELKNEPILSNFLADGLSDWVNVSQIGLKPRRSIPQGSGVSSFFGNIYLMPIDAAFEKIANDYDFKYIRYMDDIRVFTKDIKTARMAIFLLEKVVRDLHLNLQSSKTKILVESVGNKEITKSLFDDRIDKIKDVREALNQLKISEAEAEKRLKRIARLDPSNSDKLSKKLLNVKDPKSNLTDRAMRMWMSTSIAVGSKDYINTLFGQIYTNPDQRLSRIYVNSCIAFPRNSSLGDVADRFIQSDSNIHAHQESELLRGCRYLSSVPDGIWRRALGNVLNKDTNFQLRTQSLLLLGMRSHNERVMESIFRAMKNDTDIINHAYYSSVLGQWQGDKRTELMNYYLHHANPHNQEYGLLLQRFDQDFISAKRFIDHIFGADVSIADWQGMIFHISASPKSKIRDYLLDALRARIKGRGRKNLTDRLAVVRNRILNTN